MLKLVSCCSHMGVRVPLQQWAGLWAVCGNAAALHTAPVMEAARKGTRAKAEAKKKAHKKVEVKQEFIPLKKRLELQQTGGLSPRRVDNHLKDPIDDVWITRYFKWKVYSVRSAVEMHRETHHPTQINLPHAHITACIELDMTADKKTRYLDNFRSVVRVPHDFETEQERSLMVVSRSQEVLETARQMGATYSASTDIVKLVQNGEVNLRDYDHIIAETDVVPDLISIRGLLKKQFPSVKNGTAGSDLIPIIERFTKGIQYETTKNKFHHDYGTIQVPFGKLSMSDDQLEENLCVLLRDVLRQGPPRTSHPFITMVSIRSFPSTETFKIDHTLYTTDKKPETLEAAAAI